MVDGEAPQSGLFPMKVGERLRIAREKGGLDLNDVATRTRVPVRHLDAIERSDYAALPSSTYAVGFAKSYARAVGLDEVALAADLRGELGRVHPGAHEPQSYEPADPSRVPSRFLAWTAALLALIFAVGYGIWRSGYLADAPVRPESDTVSTAGTPSPKPAPPPAASNVAPATGGDVVLTATAPVWLRITDADQKRIFEKEMAAGESFTVPGDAKDPRILTGRADALKVTVGGRDVAPLGAAERTISDVGVSAAALAARPAVAPAPAPVTQ